MAAPSAQRFWQSHTDTASAADRHLAEALRVIAASTRSGGTLEQALVQAGSRADDSVAASCRLAAAEMNLGVPVEHALTSFARRSGSAHAWLLARVVGAQHRRGGDLGHLCHRLARLLHERRRLRDEARSATAQARFTARAVVALPVLLILGWAWLSPHSLAQMITPASALIASPALIMLLVGVVVVRRLAASAARIDPPQQTATRFASILRVIAGTGLIRTQQIRMGCIVGAPLLLLLVMHPTVFVFMCTIAATAGAVWWPVAQVNYARSQLESSAVQGLPDVLETSIALLSAGCTPREVLETVLEVCPGELGTLLRPALHQISLGRTPFSALAALDVVQQSPELEAWAFALTDGSRHGAPVTEVLESLLRDIRSAERERFRSRTATVGPRIQLAVVLLIVPAIMWLMLVGAAQGLVGQMSAAGIV